MDFFGPVTINLFALKVNAIDHGAVINLGPSKHIDMYVSYKRNQGIGEQNGDISPIFMTNCSVFDSDLIDAPAVKNSII